MVKDILYLYTPSSCVDEKRAQRLRQHTENLASWSHLQTGVMTKAPKECMHVEVSHRYTKQTVDGHQASTDSSVQ